MFGSSASRCATNGSSSRRCRFKDPKQLDGKRVGYHAPITVTEALVKWMAQHYKITPNWMIIPGSDVRAEALMRGQLDATPAEIGDVLNILQRQARPVSRLDLLRQDFPSADRLDVLRPRRLRAKERRDR